MLDPNRKAHHELVVADVDNVEVGKRGQLNRKRVQLVVLKGERLEGGHHANRRRQAVNAIVCLWSSAQKKEGVKG